MSEKCKALTICQPYAELIVRGEKRVENRFWRAYYRGMLLIHAGKSKSYMQPGDAARFPDMSFGAVVGVCQLAACYARESIDAGQVAENHHWLRDHEHTEGPYCLVLEDVDRFQTPVAMPGQRGLFDVELTEELLAAIKSARPAKLAADARG